MTCSRTTLVALAALLSASLTPMQAAAQAWPARPLKMIVPFAAGGATDVIGRLMAQKLSDTLGQQVVVENRGGAGSTVGTDMTAKSSPDGYTIGMVANTSLVTAPFVYPNVAYRPIEDLTYLAMIGTFARRASARTCRVRSNPSMRGISISTSITPGTTSRSFSIASTPSLATTTS